MSRRLEAHLDGPTERLVLVAKSVAAGDWLPTATARNLVASATGVRAALLGRAPTLAQLHLDAIAEICASIETDRARRPIENAAMSIDEALRFEAGR